MKKRFLIIYFVVITALLAFSALVAISGEEDVTAVQDSAFLERMRPLAVFNHEEHNEKAEIDDCAACHHLYEDGELVEDESSEDMECSYCHAREGESSQLTLINTYHKQCKGCHMEEKKGPVMCNECHLKY